MDHPYTVLLNLLLAIITNMFNPLKIKMRIKIFVAIIIALFISFLFLLIKPKENDIPVQPLALKLELSQQPDYSLMVKGVSIQNVYSPDYQTDIQNNFYTIEIKNKNKLLFTGKTVKKHIIINEWLGENPRNEVREELLGDYIFYLPYYKEATELIMTDEKGREALRIDLSTQNLKAPPMRNTCGDGICSDNENLLMCYTDCKYLLPKWLPK